MRPGNRHRPGVDTIGKIAILLFNGCILRGRRYCFYRIELAETETPEKDHGYKKIISRRRGRNFIDI